MKPTDKICPFLNRNCLGISCAIYCEHTFNEFGNCAVKQIAEEIENIRRIEQKTGGY